MTSATPQASVETLARDRTVEGDGLRHDWNVEEILALFQFPFNDLLFEAHRLHRRHFDPNCVQISTLLSVKTGGCPEDCKYCSQSSRYDTGLGAEKLLSVEEVISEAKKAREAGATRFCMGAAWRNPKDRDLPHILDMIREVKALGLETCATLGMLSKEQADALKEGGLDYYNHNVDTSEKFYGEIITTRTYRDRIDTLSHVRAAGMKVCAGGIIGMGEERADRAGMLQTLANLPEHPESVPINLLIRIPGTPLEVGEELDPIEFVRTVAVARVLMPKSVVRLSAGREHMTDEMQALCFFAGANSIFYGEKLLTAGNPEASEDRALFERLGLKGEARPSVPRNHSHG
ncbi:MAG: biotin synthase BioB [Alphaproteobacteria bacterium]|nr:biotin synthase BioB [Alphaproteobacteria bacterium]